MKGLTIECPIIPELFSVLFTTDYSQNYSGIIDACLNITQTPVDIQKQVTGKAN